MEKPTDGKGRQYLRRYSGKRNQGIKKQNRQIRADAGQKGSRAQSAKKFFRFLRIEKFAIVEYARSLVEAKTISQNRACKLFGISKNTYNNCQNIQERFAAKYNKFKAKIKAIIKNNSAYGIKRIKAELKRKYGLHIGRDALQRLLNVWGLQLRRKIKKSRPGLIQKILNLLADKTNLLIRTKIIQPFQAITSDITEIWYDNFKKKAYLCVHKDFLGQMVYGWNVSQRMTAQIVIASLEMAEKRMKKMIGRIKEILLHQDRGTQYTGYEYVDCSLKEGFTLSYSSPGTPTENPGQESFFGRFKDENQDALNEIKDFKTLEKFINKKIKYYNQKRLHTSIGNVPPEEFTKDFLKNNILKKAKKRFSFFRT